MRHGRCATLPHRPRHRAVRAHRGQAVSGSRMAGGAVRASRQCTHRGDAGLRSPPVVPSRPSSLRAFSSTARPPSASVSCGASFERTKSSPADGRYVRAPAPDHRGRLTGPAQPVVEETGGKESRERADEAEPACQVRRNGVSSTRLRGCVAAAAVSRCATLLPQCWLGLK